MKVKQILLIVFGGVLLVVTVVIGLSVIQANHERESLSSDLEYRTGLLADSLKESIEPYYLVNSKDSLQKIIDKFTNREHLVGLAIFDSKGIKIASSADLTPDITDGNKTVSLAMDTDKPAGSFLKNQNGNLYVYILPLHQLERVAGAFAVVQDANYIETSVWQIVEANLLRLFAPIVFFFLIFSLIIWFVIYKPIKNMVESVRSARIGKSSGTFAGMKDHFFFKPLATEISNITKSLRDARFSASEEARMRLEKLDTPWTAERLKEFIKAYLKDRKIFIVTHREPYIHRHYKNEIHYYEVASGAITALKAVMEACGGTWLAQGSGDADRETVDKNDKIAVPPDEPKYTLKRIWLNEKEEKGFYSFSAEALYPLSLITHTRPIFRKEDWVEYKKVNGKYVATLLAEIKDVSQPLIFVQDYHFTLLSKMIKASRPDAQVVLFWHTPWPNAEFFSICPWRKEIIEGMLGADIIGFNTQQFCNNFIDTVGKEVESLVDIDRFAVTRDEHTSYVKTFPISIAFTNSDNVAELNSPSREALERLNIKTEYFGLGVDRLDYTKGIEERFKGVEVFFDTHPDYLGRFTFLQIASPNREIFQKYRDYADIITKEAERINKKFGTKDWQPIVLEKVQYKLEDIVPLYRLTNLCLITSLHDSMNLVAKEFVAARNDVGGVLILSQFTGASRDLKGSIVINPYSPEQIAEAIHSALIMSPTEQRRRMKGMRNSIKNYNVYRWAAEIFKALTEL